MEAKPLTDEAGEVRELTASDMDRMVPFAEMHPEFAAALPKSRSGQTAPADAARQPVHLHLDPEIIAYFKATGLGWQARINNVLKDAMRRDR